MFNDKSTGSSCIGLLTAALLLTVTQTTAAQPGTVVSHQKISDIEGDFTGILDDSDVFAASMASLGDLDGDGIGDLAVGTWFDDDGGPTRGAVWILFLNSDSTTKSYQKISSTEGGFSGNLDDSDYFSSSLASLGDLDGDGIGDLAVGAIGDDDGCGGNCAYGAIWILFLNTNGTVKSHQKISDLEGDFDGILDINDFFGGSLTSLGDLDGDGIGDLVTGAFLDDDGGPNRGALWILFLNKNGTVKSHQKISSTQGGFAGNLKDFDEFGYSVASPGDLNGDKVNDLVVGAIRDDDGGPTRGALWILFLNKNGTVKSHQKISSTQGGFAGNLDNYDEFGTSVASIGDFDGDNIGDIAVGAIGDDDSGPDRGAIWVLFLNADGTVKSHQKISGSEGSFNGNLDNGDFFGASVAALGDFDGDDITEIAVGACQDDDGGIDRGALWVLFMDGVPLPTLRASGNCPGRMTFEVTSVTPDEQIAFIYAFGPGSLTIPNGNPCIGTTLGLDKTAKLAAIKRANANGKATFVAKVPAQACGRAFLQALDLETCRITNVVGF